MAGLTAAVAGLLAPAALAAGDYPFVEAPLNLGGTAADSHDVDNDGHLDLVYSSSEQIRFLAGHSDARFEWPVTFYQGRTSGYVLADFDSAPGVDLAVCATNFNPTVRILSNAGGGTFTQTGSFYAPHVQCQLHTGDIDGDGNLDLIQPGHGTQSIAITYGNGTFGNTVSWPTSEPSR